MLVRPSIAAAGIGVDAAREGDQMSVAEQNLTSRITYTDLYRRWEKSNWSAMDLDFTQDKQGWDDLSEIQRKSALWIYSMFFFGEDRVAEDLSPYIEAAPTEEQKYFLDDTAGRRGPPRHLLPPVLQRGDRRRRRRRRDAGVHRAAPRLGLQAGLQPARQDGRRAAPRPLAAEVRAGDHALPPDRRGEPWRSRASTSSRTSSSARARCRDSPPGWRTSPATSSATSASASRC